MTTPSPTVGLELNRTGGDKKQKLFYFQMVKKLSKKWDVWKEQGCQGFEESSDEEDEDAKREPDEKFKARVASLTQTAIEWRLKRQSSRQFSRNGSAINLQQQHHQHQHQQQIKMNCSNNLLQPPMTMSPSGMFIVDKAKTTQV